MHISSEENIFDVTKRKREREWVFAVFFHIHFLTFLSAYVWPIDMELSALSTDREKNQLQNEEFTCAQRAHFRMLQVHILKWKKMKMHTITMKVFRIGLHLSRLQNSTRRQRARDVDIERTKGKKMNQFQWSRQNECIFTLKCTKRTIRIEMMQNIMCLLYFGVSIFSIGECVLFPCFFSSFPYIFWPMRVPKQ